MIDFEAKLERFETLLPNATCSASCRRMRRSASYTCASASITANWLMTCGR